MPNNGPLRTAPAGTRPAPVSVGPERPARAHRTGVGSRSGGPTDSYSLALRATALANTQLEDRTDAQALLAEEPRFRDVVTEADLHTLRVAGHRLREVFQTVAAGHERQAIDRLNGLLARYRVRPMISGTCAVDWRIHVAASGTPVVEYLATALWGLAVWLCERGINRLGVCAEPRCQTAFLDDSSNRRRRFCSDRCATRNHVRAHRARRRATHPRPLPAPVHSQQRHTVEEPLMPWNSNCL
ncbi:CGNR zinc finger domain-containing protein [Micromonospora sp. WMMD714]|uniref:CGNR zinc finger domain-containing protein n=1 Tax=Micromonospora sp. WMMD714 TaxID=3016097 RepID=UPI00249C9719|nr:CGNR zinc finger domain-containing protein [Micromonospora sp. WMMD714]WFE66560.1 CGNR zinc finger domain-containing protein [Micromonospora sp. WMMD714]